MMIMFSIFKKKINQQLNSVTRSRKKISNQIRSYTKTQFYKKLNSSEKFNFTWLRLIIIVYPEGIYPLAYHFYKNGFLLRAYKELKFCPSMTPKVSLLRERIEEMLYILRNKQFPNLGTKKTISVQFNQRILFALHNSLPHDGAGYALRSHAILTFLSRQKIEVLAATRLDYPWDLNKHAAQPRYLKNQIDGISYLRLTGEKVTYGRVKDSIYVEHYANKLVSLARHHQASIIHSASNFLNGLAAIRAARELGIWSVYEVRGLWHLSRASKEANFDQTDLYRYQEIMEQIAVREADAVIVISEALRDELRSWGIDKNKISVIPNAVDLSRFSSQKPDLELKQSLGLQDCFVIGFLGSLTAYEGLDLLIKAVSNLLDQGKPIGLVIVGDGQIKEQLEAMAKTTSKPDRIIFTGRVPFEEVNKYYSIFDLCPLPRKSYEVCKRVPPLKILEILAMGKPTIVSNLPPLLEIIEDHKTGRVCQADSIENLQEVILEIYNYPEITQRLSQAGQTWVEQNRSWEIISQEILKVYEKLGE